MVSKRNHFTKMGRYFFFSVNPCRPGCEKVLIDYVFFCGYTGQFQGQNPGLIDHRLVIEQDKRPFLESCSAMIGESHS